MSDVRIIKFDVGSPTDTSLTSIQQKLGASTKTEAMRRSLGIAETMIDIAKDKKRKLIVENEDGTRQEFVIS